MGNDRDGELNVKEEIPWFFKDYRQLDEEEKNHDLQQSLIRLQDRIYKIVNMMNEELNRREITDNNR
jgi:hypothetical protein